MRHELITLWGYRTGGFETPTSIRNDVAFDLTRLDLRNQRMVSAAMHIQPSPGQAPTAAVRLSDPSQGCHYGQADDIPHEPDDMLRVPLTAEAIADLRAASGAFFAISAQLQDEDGLPQRLPIAATQHRLVVTVAQSAHAAAA